MPCDYSKYPADWKTRIRPAVLARAQHKCEFCGLENYLIGHRNRDGVFIENFAADRRRRGYTQIVLTVAHLNHDVTDNRMENLRALCQRCHLRHDAEDNKKNARKTRRRKRFGTNNQHLPNFNQGGETVQS